jgi:hypothetical protein
VRPLGIVLRIPQQQARKVLRSFSQIDAWLTICIHRHKQTSPVCWRQPNQEVETRDIQLSDPSHLTANPIPNASQAVLEPESPVQYVWDADPTDQTLNPISDGPSSQWTSEFDEQLAPRLGPEPSHLVKLKLRTESPTSLMATQLSDSPYMDPVSLGIVTEAEGRHIFNM